MKKFLFGAAATVLALGACSSDDVLQSSHDSDAISFAVTNSTTSRAAQSYCNTNMPASFNVAAQIHGQSDFYFQDTPAREGESTIYSTSTQYWWPQEGTLDFHAWVNHNATYDAEKNKFQFVDFAPAATVSEQLDLLYGVAMEQNKAAGNVKLNFRHALSQIVFSARTEATSYNVAVKGVEIGHLNNKGTFTFGGVSTTENYVNHKDKPNGTEGKIKGGAGEWTLNGGLSTYATSFTPVTLKTGADAVELTKVEHEGGPDGSLLLLPQHQDAWVPAAAEGVADNDGFKGAYFLLDVELTNAEGVNLYTGKMAVPVEIDWEQGTRYRYTFVFTDGNGGFTPDPDDPKPVLGGIKYDVTTDDFVPVNGGEKKPGDDPRPAADKYAYTLNFDANGGNGSMDALVVNDITADSYSFTAPACTMTRDKYQFKGWNTKADGSGVTYKEGEAVPVSGVAGQNVKTTLYAQWEYLYETITVNFDTDGEGTVTAMSQEVLKGQQATFTLPGVNIDQDAKGYGFEGWSYSPAAKKPFNAGEEDLLPEDLKYMNEEITIDHSVTLHAVYFKATSVIGGGGDNPEIED